MSDDPIRPDPTLLWAKFGAGTAGYHPLICHMVDVSMVVLALWDTSVAPATRTSVARRLGMEEGATGRWLAFWAGLHDLGKASPGFQAKRPEAIPRLKASGFGFTKRHDEPHGAITTVTLGTALSDQRLPGGLTHHVAIAIGAHHGTFPRAHDRQRAKGASGGKSWERGRRDLANLLADTVDVPTAAPSGDMDPILGIWFAGLVSIADWIGSDASSFPYETGSPADSTALDIPTYARRSAWQARQALDRLGWSAFPPTATVPFERLFPAIATPNPLQREIVHLAASLTETGLVIIEAPMGEGKTEAALYLADHGAVAGRGGTYVALPTQATSDQMLSRVRSYLSKRFPTDVVNLQLLHGQAALSAEFAELRSASSAAISPSSMFGDGNGDENVAMAGVVAAEWFTHRKRGLLSPFGVGTIDQALLAILQTRHGFVRLHGLSGKTVIIDEVHAYDAYMSVLLERLLAWLAALGTPVVLLSATLSAGKRQSLMAAYARGLGIETEPQSATSYPRISWVTPRQSGSRPIETSALARKVVQIAWFDGSLPGSGISFGLGERLRQALADGGRAAVICNTVGRAQAVYRALAPYFPDAAEDGEPELDLFHARFRHDERQRREHRTLRRFGKAGTAVRAGSDSVIEVSRPHRAVVVATQVIEQSLDLDFDLMVTDIAPVDLVLQRSGRLHRHDRGDRPVRLSQPSLWLGRPSLAADVPTFDAGTSAVYDAHVLLRSWLALRDLTTIAIPAGVEHLIDLVYDAALACPGSADADLRERWETTRDEQCRTLERDEAIAKSVLILPPDYPDDFFEGPNQQLEEDDPDAHASIQALTRLGDQRIPVVCLTPEEAEGFSDTNRPDRERTIWLLRRSVAIADRRVINDLKGRTPPTGWRRSPLMRHHRLVTLDANGACALGRHRLRLDPDLGIVIERGDA